MDGASQKRHKQHHGCDKDVLKDQDGKGEASHRRGGDPFLLEDVQYYGRGGQRKEASPENALGEVSLYKAHHSCDADDKPYLQTAAKEHWTLQSVENLSGKLHADGEHEHGNAKVSCRGDDLHVVHKAKQGRAGQDTREQKPHGDRYLETGADNVDHNSQKKDDENLGKNFC